MNVVITGRRFNVSTGLKNAIEEKLGRLRVLDNHDVHFHVLLEKEKLNYSADISFVLDRKKFYLQIKAPTLSEAIDTLVDKLERQVRKHKERAQSYSHERVADSAPPPALRYTEPPPETQTELEVLLRLADSEYETEVFYPEENPAKAMAAQRDGDELFTLYGCDAEDGAWYCKQVYLADGQIDRTSIEDCRPEPMDDAEAVSKMEREQSGLLVYKNTGSNRIQALIRNQDSYLVYVLER